MSGSDKVSTCVSIEDDGTHTTNASSAPSTRALSQSSTHTAVHLRQSNKVWEYTFAFVIYVIWGFWSNLYRLLRQTDRLEQLNSTNQNLYRENDEVISANKILKQENKRLKCTKQDIELQKNDALSRLSQMVSEKLRDNNPNIVDLNDQFRPTKLAEMFSELYDNEWTDAYDALENRFENGRLTQVLLYIVMECYTFCEREVANHWRIISQSYLPKGAAGELTRKQLKDALKQKVPNLVPEIKTKFLGRLRSIDVIASILGEQKLEIYTERCVLLCMFMAATDPPVVMYCPDEVLLSVETPKDEMSALKVVIKNEKQRQTASPSAQPATDEPMGAGLTKIPRKYMTFDKEMFKDYTKRGPYVEYYVWPALQLHKDGPLLARGVAQGTH